MFDPATTKFAASAFSAAVASDPGPVISGNAGATDMRSAFDGSGWTVSTGRSSATGARDSRTGAPYGTGLGESLVPSQAGASPVLILALCSVAAGWLLTR